MDLVSIIVSSVSIVIALIGLLVSIIALHKSQMALKINLLNNRQLIYDLVIDIFNFLDRVSINQYKYANEFIKYYKQTDIKKDVLELHKRVIKCKETLHIYFKLQDIKFTFRIIESFCVLGECFYNNTMLEPVNYDKYKFLLENCNNRHKAKEEFDKYINVSKIK